MNVKDLINLPAARLKRAAELKNQIERLQSQLETLVTGVMPPTVQKIVGAKRKMSAAARHKISLAAKARWAKVRAAKAK